MNAVQRQLQLAITSCQATLVVFLSIGLLWSTARADHAARFSSSTLQRGIEAFLREHIEESDQITFLAPIEPVQFDRGHVVAFCRLPNGQVWGRTEVEISFQSDGRQLKTMRVPVLVTAYRMVPVATRSLRRGDIVTTGDVRYELRDATRFVQLLPDSVLGMRLAQSITPGTVLLRTHLVAHGSIQSGDNLTLVLQSGAITIRTTARALHAASCGDTVKVRRTDTGAVLVGVLTDSKTVVVNLGSSSTTTESMP